MLEGAALSIALQYSWTPFFFLFFTMIFFLFLLNKSYQLWKALPPVTRLMLFSLLSFFHFILRF